MRHTKLTGLQSVAERMAQAATAAREASRGEATTALGPVSVLNQDGTRTVMGLGNDDGTTMATHVGDVTPPGVPTGVTASAQGLLVTISWDGSLQGGIPGDFMWVNLMVDGVVVGHLTHAGSQTVRVREGERAITASSEDDACLPDGRASHNRSSPCAPITVTAAALPTKEDTRQVAMLVSLTPSGTAAKEAASQGGMPAMEVGLVAHCNFSDANVMPYPTLSIDGGEPQAIMTNGAPFAYWVAGTTLTLLWDGSDWQNCSAPVYGATATIGNPAAANVTIDSDSVDFRTGGDHVGGTITRDGASFNDGSLQIGAYHYEDPSGTLRYATVGTGNTANEFGGLYLTRGAGIGTDVHPSPDVASIMLERGNDGTETVKFYGRRFTFNGASLIFEDSGLQTIYAQSGYGTVQYRAYNGVCYLTWDVIGIPANGQYIGDAIPSKYAPRLNVFASSTSYSSDHAGSCWVGGTGNSDIPGRVWLQGYDQSRRLVGSASWFYIA